MHYRTMEDLKDRPLDILTLCDFTRKPVFLTQDREVSYVMMSADTFRRLMKG